MWQSWETFVLQLVKKLTNKGFSPQRGAWLLLTVALALALLPSDAAEARRYASIVIDTQTGRVLHADNPDRRAYPASLTKMMTLYMVFEALDIGKLKMNQKLPVSRRAAGMPPSKLGLRRGSTIRVEDAIMALITKSANDVATVVAESLGGTESNFAKMMTAKAKSLGMKNTTFRNASGLPNKHQLSTARDMARLAQALMRHFPRYYKLFSTRSFSYKGRNYRNHNKLLRTYKGTDGIKTGYTRASGYNLVASAVRNNRRIIAVVFGGKTGRSRDKHMAKLLNRGFARAKNIRVAVRPLSHPPPRKPGVETTTQLAALPQAAGTSNSGLTANAAVGSSLAGAALAAVPVQPEAQSPAAKTSDNKTSDKASQPDMPAFREIPKREPTGLALISPDSQVPKPPAYAAIPERDDYDSAQGSADSPVRMPPPYASIPQRPNAAVGSSAAPQSTTKSIGKTSDSSSLRFKLLPQKSAAILGNWGIQVGAYAQYTPAQVAAQDAARKLSDVFGAQHINISEVLGTKGVIFRARLLGIEEGEARAACSRLEKLNTPCHVVPPAQQG